jgi:hypothetical protein
LIAKPWLACKRSTAGWADITWAISASSSDASDSSTGFSHA